MEQHQKAFETFLDHLVSPPVIFYPDFRTPFVLHTDASQEGLGAVLYQKQDGKMRFIGYGLQLLAKTQKKHLQQRTRLQLTACLMTLCYGLVSQQRFFMIKDGVRE